MDAWQCIQQTENEILSKASSSSLVKNADCFRHYKIHIAINYIYILQRSATMSHYTVGVICTPEEIKDKGLELAVHEKLAPFDANLTVPLYVKATKEQLIEKSKQRIEIYANTTYKEYLADPKGYVQRNSQHVEHLKYLQSVFPEKLTWTDEQHYKEAIKYYEPESIGPNGEIISDYNPNAKWDRYSIGGRWKGALPTDSKQDYAAIKNIQFKKHSMGTKLETEKEKELAQGTAENDVHENDLFTTYAILTSDGTWHEAGEMGYSGISYASTKEQRLFKKNYLKIIEKENPNNIFVLVDCHIYL